ncbi:MAG: hypothetical protein JXA16_02365 [Bacteroidales bacterium]|nr:hypothetical protein [Bacteroidales bacterium]
MKTKKYFFLLMFAILAFQMQAQSVKSYIIQSPSKALLNVKEIFVEGFENEGQEFDNLKDIVKNGLKFAFSNDHYGISDADVKINFNPWAKTDLYKIIDDNEKAQAIFTGKYKATGDEKSSEKLVDTKEQAGFYYQIPYSYYEYSESANISYSGSMDVFKKELNKVVYTIPLEKNDEFEKKANYKKPNSLGLNGVTNSVAQKIQAEVIVQFVPRLVPITYEFEKIKSKDKTLKEDIKEAKKLAKDDKVKEAGVLYKKICDQTNDADAALNTAMCYEMIGNYTKAKEYYEKTGNQKNVNRIIQLIALRDLYIKLGREVVEGEF